MAFDALVRGGINLAKNLTNSLQANVQHLRWTGQSALGTPTYATAVTLKALVERKQKVFKRASGVEVMSQSVITILEPLSAQGTAGRIEPVDERDQFILPDGTTSLVIAVEGFVDGSTGKPYMHQIYLGTDV